MADLALDRGVAAVLSSMNDLVQRDGGSLKLEALDHVKKRLQVAFATAAGDPECSTCAITPDMMRNFLVEAIRAHGLDIDTVEMRVVDA